MQSQQVERIICLGDVIGYGPEPGKCLDLVKKCGAVLMGNHEAFCLGAEASILAPARRSTGREIISKPDADDATRDARWKILNNLQVQAKLDSFLFLHASPRQPTREYIMPRDCKNPNKMGEIFEKDPTYLFCWPYSSARRVSSKMAPSTCIRALGQQLLSSMPKRRL